jgi:hypothetical protein
MPDPAPVAAAAETGETLPREAAPPPKNARRAKDKRASVGHARVRQRAHDRIRTGHRAAAAVPWGVAAALLVAGSAAALHWRTDIVRAWPRAASAFALVGQPANLYGIDIDKVEIRAGYDVTGQRLVIRGELRSVSRKPEAVPYLQVALIEEDGREKARWMVDPGVLVLQPGQTHPFQTVRANPPTGMLRAVVVFEGPPPGAPRPPPAPPEPPTGGTGLMGAKSPAKVPVEAPHGEAPPAPAVAR